MKALILAGGQGTRLWPISRKQKPKQFQKLVSKKTMLQETVARLLAKFSLSEIFISTNNEYRNEVKEQLPDLAAQNIIGEPLNRERMASILFFMAMLKPQDLREPILVLPSDHVIKDRAAFLAATGAAQKFVADHSDYIVIIGSKPTFPDTGMGYIKAGKLIASGDSPIYKVDFFKEKPNLKRTSEYVASGQYHWNTAIYVFYPLLIEKLVKKYVPDNYYRYNRIKKALLKKDAASVENEYSQMDKTGLEYSIIENYGKVAVIGADMGWSDVGSWTVLKNVLSSPKKSYIKGNFVGIESKNIMVLGAFDKLVAGVGIKDLVIVVTDDIILVCNKDHSQKVKQVIEKLEKQRKFNYI